MAKNDKDLKIGVATVYDGSGAQRALDDMERVKTAAAELPQGGGTTAAELPPAQTQGEKDLAAATKTAADAAADAAKAQAALTDARSKTADATQQAAAAEKEMAGALQQTAAQATAQTAAAQQAAAQQAAQAAEKVQQQQTAARAADDAAAKEDALRRMMDIEARGMGALVKELKELERARVAAARAGDVKQYEALTKRTEECNAAMGKLKQGLELGKMGMAQQMQVAMGAGAAVQGLANDVQNGTVSVGGMANAFLALSAAIKTGMGPIGWIMLAIQGLQIAWDIYAQKQEKAKQKERERMEAEEEALKRHWERVAEFSNLDRENMTAQLRKEVADIEQDLTREAQERANIRKREDIAAQEADDKRAAAARAAFDAEAARIEAMKTAGQISAAEAERRKRAAEDLRDKELAAVEDAAALRQNKEQLEQARASEKIADNLEAELKERYGAFEEVLSVKMPTAQEWKALEIKLQEGLGDMRDAEFRKEAHEKIAEVRGILEQMGRAWTGTDEELVAWLDSMREARKTGTERVQTLRDTAQQERLGARESAAGYRVKQEERAEQERARDAARAAADAQTEAARREEEWQSVARRGLNEQRAWLQQTLTGLADGSDAAKKWAAQLRQVNAAAVTDELARLGDTFKVTGTYAREDTRMQAQIFLADRKALQQRRAKLQALAASPDIDAATQRQINDKLKETDAQLRGLRDAMHKSAAEAARAVDALKPLGQKATSKGAQGSLKRLEKAYARMAQNAARQASKGNTAALDRSIAAMKRNALAQERLTGHSGRAAAHMRETEGHLRLIATGTKAEERGLTVQQRQRRAVERALGVESRHQKSKGDAVKQAGDAAKKEAAARKKAAADAAKQQQQQKPKAAAQNIGDMTAKLNDATAQMRELQGKVAALSAAVSQLADAAKGCAAAAAGAANTAAGKIGALKNELNAVKAAVNNLRKG